MHRKKQQSSYFLKSYLQFESSYCLRGGCRVCKLYVASAVTGRMCGVMDFEKKEDNSNHLYAYSVSWMNSLHLSEAKLFLMSPLRWEVNIINVFLVSRIL